MIFNFLREDFSEVIGAYHDGTKIYLSRRVGDKIENIDVNFSVDDDANISGVEQLAEKISALCSQRGWSTSKMGLCLREGVALTFQTQFGTISPQEIDDAVKIWATAQVGKGALYDSIKSDGEVWMEAIDSTTAEDYIKIWRNNGMKLCALTIMPEEITMRLNLTKPITHAEFVAEVVAKNKTPNLIAEYLTAWNYKKISLAIAAGFLIAFTLIFVQTSYKYQVAAAQLETAQSFVDEHAADLETKKFIEKNISEMRRLNENCAAQNNSMTTFNALVQIGKIADGKTRLTKIKSSANSIELEGISEDTDEIKSYVNRLKKITPQVKLGNFSSEDGSTKFTVHLRLKD